MISRRNFLKGLGYATTAGVSAGCTRAFAMKMQHGEWHMPEEGDRHLRTWMAFGANERVWGRRLLADVQHDLARIALAIADYEPVTMLVRESDYARAKKLMGKRVDLMIAQLDDLWMRDIGPVFIVSQHGKKAVDFNFNGWGEKQDYTYDRKVAALVAERAGVGIVPSMLTLEGGGIEVDGQGTAIITQSCVINANRNPRVSQAQCEQELKRLLGLKKIIWLPGIKGRDITDGHTDFYARFAKPGVVVAAYDPDPLSFDHAVTRQHLDILRRATDVNGRPLDVVELEAPTHIRYRGARDDFAAGYVNFYVCNGAVIMPEFGDARADSNAKRKLAKLFPNRDIVQLAIDALAAGGGGIHCTTMQEPANTVARSAD